MRLYCSQSSTTVAEVRKQEPPVGIIWGVATPPVTSLQARRADESHNLESRVTRTELLGPGCRAM